MTTTGKLTHFELMELALPMRMPFVHARATRSLAESVFVRLVLDGHVGLGEGVPRDYVTGETLASAYEAIAALDLGELERAIDLGTFRSAVLSIEALDLPSRLRQGEHLGHAAACTVELALLDAVGRKFDQPLSALSEVIDVPPALRQTQREYPMSIVLDMRLPPAEQRKLLKVHPTHVKVKIGGETEADLQRLRDVRDTFGWDTTVAVDVNMAWTLEQAVALQPAMKALRIEWYEEPFAQRDLAACRAFREQTGGKVMLDESLCSFADGEKAIAEKGVDYFNIRVSKNGGLIASVRLVILGHRHGVGFQVGAQIGEMSVLCAASRHLHGIVAGAVAYEGSNVRDRFETQITEPPLQVDLARAMVPAQPGPGLGLIISPTGLDAARRRTSMLRRDTVSFPE